MASIEMTSGTLAEKYDLALRRLYLFLDKDPWTSRETKIASKLEDSILRLKIWGHEIGHDDGILTEAETKSKDWASAILYFLCNIEDCIEKFAFIREDSSKASTRRLADAEAVLETLQEFVKDLTSSVTPFLALRDISDQSGFFYSLRTGEVFQRTKTSDISYVILSQQLEKSAKQSTQGVTKPPPYLLPHEIEEQYAVSKVPEIPETANFPSIARTPTFDFESRNDLVRPQNSAQPDPLRPEASLRLLLPALSSSIPSIIVSAAGEEDISFQKGQHPVLENTSAPANPSNLLDWPSLRELRRLLQFRGWSVNNPRRSYADVDVHLLTAREKWDAAIERFSFWAQAGIEHTPFLHDYWHTPLKMETSLRLVKLMPAMFGSDLKCEILQVQPRSTAQNHLLSWDCEPFEAISWAWSRESPRRTLYIRNGSVWEKRVIPLSLESCLKALRLESKPRMIWIDYLCLDRSKHQELKSQPWLFHSIFAAATTVCVWLGDQAQMSDTAINFIKTTAQRSSSWWDTNLVKDSERQSKMPDVLTLLQRPWFSRRWIVQEVAWSRNCEIYCGSNVLSWNDLSSWVTCVAESESLTGRPAFTQAGVGKDSTPAHEVEIKNLHVYRLMEICNQCIRKIDDDQKFHMMSLEYLVTSLSQFHVSLPHDSVYSLLSLAAESASRPTQYHQYLNEVTGKPVASFDRKSLRIVGYHVDDKQPYHKFCMDFVQFSVCTSGLLDIICRPWAPNSGSEFDNTKARNALLPSWVAEAKQAGPHINSEVLVGLPITNGSRYRASGNSTVNLDSLIFKSYQTHSSMSVRGFILSDLKAITSTSHAGDIPGDWPAFSGWGDIKSLPPESYWRTLLADRGLSGGRADMHYQRVIRELYLTLAKDSRFHEISAKKANETTVTLHVKKIIQKIQTIVCNRRLARLSHRSILSLVPEKSQEGDLICILYGCSVPVVLRKCPKTKSEIWEQRESNMREESAAIIIQRLFREYRQRSKMSQPTKSAVYQSPDDDEMNLEPVIGFKLRGLQDQTGIGRIITSSIRIVIAILSTYLLELGIVYLRSTNDPQPTSLLWIIVLPHVILISLLLDLRKTFDISKIIVSNNNNKNNKNNTTNTTNHNPQPLTLSPPINSHKYTLIGECYIHNMMDGEALIMKEEMGIISEVFELI